MYLGFLKLTSTKQEVDSKILQKDHSTPTKVAKKMTFYVMQTSKIIVPNIATLLDPVQKVQH